jgi:hypothetical protein
MNTQRRRGAAVILIILAVAAVMLAARSQQTTNFRDVDMLLIFSGGICAGVAGTLVLRKPFTQ